MKAPRKPSDECIETARDLAWSHFELHARHRMEMFRSFVTFIAIVYAGYGWSLQAKAYWVGVLLGLFAIFLSVSFLLFDLRIRQLLKISEEYLKDEEERLSKALTNSNILIFKKSDDAVTAICGFRITYTTLFRWIYAFNIFVSLGFWATLLITANKIPCLVVA